MSLSRLAIPAITLLCLIPQAAFSQVHDARAVESVSGKTFSVRLNGNFHANWTFNSDGTISSDLAGLSDYFPPMVWQQSEAKLTMSGVYEYLDLSIIGYDLQIPFHLDARCRVGTDKFRGIGKSDFFQVVYGVRFPLPELVFGQEN